MGDVIKLGGNHTTPQRDLDTGLPLPFVDGPHIGGDAFCGACHHEWQVVAPHGTTVLECPKCERLWGAFKHLVEPEVAWRCACGEQLFWLTPTGAMCRRCGVRCKEWAE